MSELGRRRTLNKKGPHLAQWRPLLWHLQTALVVIRCQAYHATPSYFSKAGSLAICAYFLNLDPKSELQIEQNKNPMLPGQHRHTWGPDLAGGCWFTFCALAQPTSILVFRHYTTGPFYWPLDSSTLTTSPIVPEESLIQIIHLLH